MRIYSGPRVFLFLLALSLVASVPSPAQHTALATAKFGNHPALPTCVTMAVVEGDPSKGPSILLLKFKEGCVVPWHWHSVQETLIGISGTGHAIMKGMAAVELKQGDSVVLPAKGIHQFHAATDVVLYDVVSAAFDIHYVDAAGKEIPVEKALKGSAGH